MIWYKPCQPSLDCSVRLCAAAVPVWPGGEEGGETAPAGELCRRPALQPPW